MHDISCKTAPVLIQNLFIETRNVHKYNTRSAKSGNYFTQYSRLELKACSFSKSGTDIWTGYQQIPKLCAILQLVSCVSVRGRGRKINGRVGSLIIDFEL